MSVPFETGANQELDTEREGDEPQNAKAPIAPPRNVGARAIVTLDESRQMVLKIGVEGRREDKAASGSCRYRRRTRRRRSERTRSRSRSARSCRRARAAGFPRIGWAVHVRRGGSHYEMLRVTHTSNPGRRDASSPTTGGGCGIGTSRSCIPAAAKSVDHSSVHASHGSLPAVAGTK